MDITEDEKLRIAEAVMLQKVGVSAKSVRAQIGQIKDAKKGSDREAATMLIKLSRVGHGATVRWARSLRPVTEGSEGLEASSTGNCDEVAYTSRKLTCTRCGSQQETSWMQLRTWEGFRAVHCRTCGKQERCLRNRCQCGSVWHQCILHRADPKEHTSRKAAVKSVLPKTNDQDDRATASEPRKNKRKEEAPVIEDGNPTKNCNKRRKIAKEQQFHRNIATDDQRLNPTMCELLQRVKHKKRESQNQATASRCVIARRCDTTDVGDKDSGRKVPRTDDCQEDQPKVKARKQDQDVVEDRRRATKAMHDAVSNQQAKRRRQDAAAKVEEDLSALYDDDPQLPGKQGGTQAILERLTSESRGRPSSAIKACSLKPSKNSEGEQLASQMGKNLLRQETAGRISKGEMHAINNILKGKPRDY